MSSVSSAMRRRVSGRHEIERAHVVQPVGELDQQHADVVGDGEQQLAQVLGLRRLLGDEVELLELGQAVDQRADLAAEQLVDLGARRRGVLDGVVQQRRDDGRVVELEVGQDRGDFERMREVGIAGGALLRAMRLHGVDVGAVEQVLVGVRIVALTRSTSSYWRIIRGSTALAAAPRSRPARSSGAGSITRCAGRWFCIRGSVGLRARHGDHRAAADHRPRRSSLRVS